MLSISEALRLLSEAQLRRLPVFSYKVTHRTGSDAHLQLTDSQGQQFEMKLQYVPDQHLVITLVTGLLWGSFFTPFPPPSAGWTIAHHPAGSAGQYWHLTTFVTEPSLPVDNLNRMVEHAVACTATYQTIAGLIREGIEVQIAQQQGADVDLNLTQGHYQFSAQLRHSRVSGLTILFDSHIPIDQTGPTSSWPFYIYRSEETQTWLMRYTAEDGFIGGDALSAMIAAVLDS